MTRVAILDDYQGVALAMADWKSLGPGVSVQAFHETLSGEDTLAKGLGDFEVIVAMRERTHFPRSLLERLPKLKLLVTTGMRNVAIDAKAGKIYSQNAGHQLLVFSAKGERERELVLGPGEGTWQILPHPDRARVLVLTSGRVYSVELRK